MTTLLEKGASFSRKFNVLQQDYFSLRNAGAQGEKLLEHRTKIYDFLESTVKGSGIKKLKDEEVKRLLDFVYQDVLIERELLFERAITLLEMFAERSNIQACTDLADIYSSCTIEPLPKFRRRARAIILYERAAKADDLGIAGYAHSRLAQLYAQHEIDTDAEDNRTEKHRNVALEHAQASAYECDSPYGHVVLGCWHYDNFIVAKDWRKCFELLDRAYQVVRDPVWDTFWIKGEAYFHYGFVLYWGHGCTQDMELGLKILKESAALGNKSAQQWLETHNGGGEQGSSIVSPDTESFADPNVNPMEHFAGRTKKARQEKAGKKIKNKKELEKLLKPLHDMIGVAPVKKEIESLIYLAHANAIRLKKNIDVSVPLSLHAAFLGSPGTGKTTVARLYANILHELGFLAQGHLIEATRMDLVGEYIGQTAPKVRALVEKAKGGVLFVDEAYSLLHDPEWDFGPEAISELLQQMENQRDNFVVVFAGYTDQMKKFLNMNPGLKSRVPNLIEFPDYSAEEMVTIFEKFCTDAKLLVTPEALERLRAHFRKLDKESVRRIGNARGVRNIFENSLVQQARRIVKENKTSRKALITLEAADIALPDDPGKGMLHVVKS